MNATGPDSVSRPSDLNREFRAGLHNFTVTALGANVPLPASMTAQWTVPEDAAPGTYESVCAEPGHADFGMVCTLTIQ